MKKKLGLILALVTIVPLLVYIWRNQTNEELFQVMDVPKFELTNQNNQTISDQDMLGKVYVVEFFFTNCPTICPIMNQNLKEVEKAISDSNFGVISITIDPKRDTPENLKIHADRLGIQNPNWHFLTGDRDYIYKLSTEFNIYVGEDESTAEGLNHSGKLALIDKNGKIRSRYDERGFPILYYSGLNYTDPEGKNGSLAGQYHPQIEWLKEDIKKLLEE
ncbi:SCO family protein [Moheibacter lacus]|nr:SCO family protein [Moheibacter lacus]